MVKMGLHVTGTQNLTARMTKMKTYLLPDAVKRITKVAEKTRDEAKSKCPVDTGSLKKSIRVHHYAKRGRRERTIGIHAGGYIVNPRTGRRVDYASYVEHGTSRMRAQPFMRPAMEKYGSEMRKATAKAVGDSK